MRSARSHLWHSLCDAVVALWAIGRFRNRERHASRGGWLEQGKAPQSSIGILTALAHRSSVAMELTQLFWLEPTSRDFLMTRMLIFLISIAQLCISRRS